ncbi:MAG: hypothetical protein KF696_10205 [Planctomycetes bacterium]|nr:hypothetical protein [Planctomycetota bacterium]MCW8135199.1 hypothetical protein [Planctomycetota bacterium]
MNRRWSMVILASCACAALSALAGLWLPPLVMLLALVTLSPLARPKRLWFVGDVESEHRIVARRRQEALRALKDLDEDRMAGKLTRDEVDRLRPGMLQAAKELTAQLDVLTEKQAAARRKIESELR